MLRATPAPVALLQLLMYDGMILYYSYCSMVYSVIPSYAADDQARIQGVGARAGAHLWGGVSPLKIHFFNSIQAPVRQKAPSPGINPVSAPDDV